MCSIIRSRIGKAVIVVLLVVMVLGQSVVVQSQLTPSAVGWGPVAFGAGAGAITTAVQYGLASCAAYCSKVWSAVTLASSAVGTLAGTALFYGSVVGLGAVAAYMLYKGLTYTGGVLYKPGPAVYSLTPGAPGTGSMSNGYTVVAGFAPNSQAAMSQCSAYAPWPGYDEMIFGCQGVPVNFLGWNGSEWAAVGMSFRLSGQRTIVWMIPGTASWITLTQTPVVITEADTKTLIQTDLAGTNGAEAQTKATAAAQAIIVA
jgi:hypothetical protein